MGENNFRAWDKKNKRMRTVITLHDKDYLDFCEYAVGQSSGDIRKLNYSDCIIMQLTGLKDKNGKAIFEGDVVKRAAAYTKRGFEIYSINWHKGIAGFFRLSRNGRYNSISKSDCALFCEVIGNIYENPELLERD